MVFFGGGLSLKKILFTLLLVVSSVVNAEVEKSVDVSGENDIRKEEKNCLMLIWNSIKMSCFLTSSFSVRI